MRWNRRLAGQLAITTVAITGMLLATSCSNPLVVDLVAESWSVRRYSNYAPITLTNVANRSGRPYDAAVITATCYNDQLESVTSEFSSGRFAIQADEVIPTLTLEHVKGWPYFIDFKVFCSFRSYSANFPAEPNPSFDVN